MAQISEIDWRWLRRCVREAVYILANRGFFRADGELDANKIKYFLLKSGQGFSLFRDGQRFQEELQKCTRSQQVELIDDEIEKWSQAGMTQSEFHGQPQRTSHTRGSWWVW
jgi:hypothetical protein